jgi:glutathione synthase/RimK-type ligase-like ATP-grasp enzyme
MLIHFATAPDVPVLTDDDRIAAAVLAARGIRVETVVWSAPAGIGRADAVVIRSCWDYHLREPAFRGWIARLEQEGVPVINPPGLVRWNLHKSYIGELEDRGVAAVPTVFVDARDARSLGEIIAAEGWEDVVVKPAVSLNAYETWRIAGHESHEHQDRFMQLRSRGDVLVQRYAPEVTTGGEWSLMFFGHQFSHAVRKLPKAGDFRVQTMHGGSVAPDVPPQRLIDDAERVLKALPEAPVYCRVDGVVVDNALIVMEVECIDPVLFFALHAPAASAFADRIIQHLENGGRQS